MRIALFHDLSSGGAKRSVFETVSRLAGRHQIDCFSLSCAEHGFADIRPIVHSNTVLPFTPRRVFESPFGRLNPIVRLADLVHLARLGERIADMIERSRYQVVLVHPCRFQNTPSLLQSLCRTPSVCYCHEPLRTLYEPPAVRPYEQAHSMRRNLLNRVDPLPILFKNRLRREDRKAIRAAGLVLVNSRFSQMNVKAAYGVDAVVSYLGVDCARFFPQERVKERMLLSVGSLTPLKGFDFLVQAVGRLPRSIRPCLTVVSNFQNPPERSYLEQMAQEYAVELRLLANIGEEELVEYYRRAAAVVYAPVREPFGLVPLEAMACGVPVIGVAEGGVGETVVDGFTGILSPRDPEAFAGSIARLLENPAQAAELGRNGRKQVEQNWTWEVAANTLENHLSTAAGKILAA